MQNFGINDRGAQNRNWISEGAAREVVNRWKQDKWVQVALICVNGHSGSGRRAWDCGRSGPPILEYTSLDDLKHVYAMNEIRLSMEDTEKNQQWVSERQILQGSSAIQAKNSSIGLTVKMQYADGDIIAVEAELSLKKPFELEENLMELLRGEEYLRWKTNFGWRTARGTSMFPH